MTKKQREAIEAANAAALMAAYSEEEGESKAWLILAEAFEEEAQQEEEVW